MATPATARRSEPLHPNLDPLQSPHRSAHHTPARTPTPRPSISPLSTASKPAKGSPIATRDATMDENEAQEDAEAHPDLVNTAADTGDIDDNRSSSLSEPEDDDEDDAMPPYMSGGGRPGVAQLTAQKSVDVDSEAETERLEETPQKLRKHADSIGRTPSKLSQAAVADDELSDPPSPLPVGAGAASSTSTIAAGRLPITVALHSAELQTSPVANATVLGLKRKRSDPEDSPLTSEESDIGESPRKRSHESPIEDATDGSAVVNGADTVERAEEENESVATPVASRETPSAPYGKGARGRKGKQKGRKPKEQAGTTVDVERPEDGIDGEQEPSEETAQKNEAQVKINGEASSTYEDLAKQFQAFREQLVNERLGSIDNELHSLHQPECLHPEYLRQVACINERRAKQQREAHAFYAYKMRAVVERTLGERAQLHSQYFQQIREQREVVLDQLGEDWHSIQKERRTQHQESDDRFWYKFPTKKSAQVRQAAKYNQEVSVLSGIAKYVGFPAAPLISGAEGVGLEDDLKAMKLVRRVQQPAPHPHHLHQQLPPQQAPQQPATFQANAQPAYSERRAHEQFLEQNAWARPQQSAAPAHGTPNLTHTTDWVDQPTSGPRHLIRNLSAQGQYGRRTGSPFATPVPSKRAVTAFPPEQPQHPPSDGPEIPSSVLAAPPTEGRLLQHGQNVFASSPLQVAKHRNNLNGTASRQSHHHPSQPPERELTGFRNISSISGTSTIDAPLSNEKPSPSSNNHNNAEYDSTPSVIARNQRLPGESSIAAALPHQAFETNALHRHPHLPAMDLPGAKEAFPGSAGFRPAEGTYGTPAPLGGSA